MGAEEGRERVSGGAGSPPRSRGPRPGDHASAIASYLARARPCHPVRTGSDGSLSCAAPRPVERRDRLVERQDRLVERQDQLVERQDRLVERQDRLVERQDRLVER
jgi:hypothetical protein